MSDVTEAAVTEEPAAPVAADAAVEPAQTEAPVVERDEASDTLEIPDSSVEGGKARYVPVSALAGARSELKTLKGELETARAGSAKATALEQQITQLQTQIQQMAPIVQAYQAAVAQPATTTVKPEDDPELAEIARDFDFYRADGSLDFDKAARHQKRTRAEAERIARAEVAPLHQQTAQQQSAFMLQRAMNTEINGQKADPDVLRTLWSRLDPSVTNTVEGAKQVFIQALGMSTALGKVVTPARGADGKFVAGTAATTTATTEQPGAPLYTEKAGGRDTPTDLPLSPAEKAYCKDVGMSEADYIKSAQSAPWLKRR